MLFLSTHIKSAKILLPKDIIKDEDIPNMIKHIKKEVYPLYPVPKYFSDEELINIFNNDEKLEFNVELDFSWFNRFWFSL